jgi:hypothetical protein
MADADALKLDYDQTTQLVRLLTDVRFRLLAFVPAITGTAVALLSRGVRPAELIAVGAVGLSATVGVVVYELRNTQIYDYAVHRAKSLEQQLGMSSVFDATRPGGLFTERPGRDVRLLGLLSVGHDRGLAVVYGAAVGGWSYIVAWGALRSWDVADAQRIGGVIGLAAAVTVVVELLRIDTRTNKAGAPAAAPAGVSTRVQGGAGA